MFWNVFKNHIEYIGFCVRQKFICFWLGFHTFKYQYRELWHVWWHAKLYMDRHDFCDFLVSFWTKDGATRGVPKIVFFDFFGALFCFTFCHFWRILWIIYATPTCGSLWVRCLWRLFACAWPYTIPWNAGSHEQKHQVSLSQCLSSLMATLKSRFWQFFLDSPWIWRLSCGIAGVGAKIGIKLRYGAEGFWMLLLMVGCKLILTSKYVATYFMRFSKYWRCVQGSKRIFDNVSREILQLMMMCVRIRVDGGFKRWIDEWRDSNKNKWRWNEEMNECINEVHEMWSPSLIVRLIGAEVQVHPGAG